MQEKIDEETELNRRAISEITDILLNVVSESNDILSSGKIEIEKENLRVVNNSIAQTAHNKKLGASLCNQYITTDFSESLLEFVTPPSKDNIENFNLLEDIHDFVLSNIGDEFF